MYLYKIKKFGKCYFISVFRIVVCRFIDDRPIVEYVPRSDDFLPSSLSFDKNLFKICRFLKIATHFFYGFSTFFL